MGLTEDQIAAQLDAPHASPDQQRAAEKRAAAARAAGLSEEPAKSADVAPEDAKPKSRRHTTRG